jgi:hypothetical protein
VQFDGEKPDKITRGACACNDDKVILRTAPGGLSKKLHAKAAAEKQQFITVVNQSFDERKIVVLRSDASDKTAKQNESDDHFRLATRELENFLNASRFGRTESHASKK